MNVGKVPFYLFFYCFCLYVLVCLGFYLAFVFGLYVCLISTLLCPKANNRRREQARRIMVSPFQYCKTRKTSGFGLLYVAAYLFDLHLENSNDSTLHS